MIHRTALQSAFVLSAILSVFSPYAFATRDGNHDFSRILLKQDREAGSNRVRIQGALTCTLNTQANDGQGCVLRLQETGTGKTFELLNATAAMRMFQSGQQNVAVEGTSDGGDAIEVSTVSAL